jgi:bacillithiol system protein YtxJ
MEWITLSNTDQVDDLVQQSTDNTAVIFKHSTTCGISRMVYKTLQREVDSLDNDNTKYYYLDLKTYRHVSNYISEKLDVRHESPQMIIIKNGNVIHHDSHHSISASSIFQL